MMRINTIEDYTKFWDDYITEWLINPKGVFYSENNIWRSLYSLDPFALPEPYCGNPSNCSAILLNFNPGSVTPNLQSHPNGQFILDFRLTGLYSDFAKTFPYLEDHKDTGGGEWWLKRHEWIQHFVMTSKKPFAIDICPWHSKAWDGISNIGLYLNYFQEYIIKPSELILQNADFKCVLSVGKLFNDIFKALNFKLIASLSPNGDFNKYPKTIKAEGIKPVQRWYQLWLSPNNKYFLNTYSLGSNKNPSRVWYDLEADFIKSNLIKHL